MSRYDIEKFDPPPDPDLVCCICQCVLDKAVECPCRHVFCQICIERWLSNRHTCPTCRKRTRKADLKPVLPLVQNMLNRLMMICDFRDNGCVDKVMLENFERHLKNCGHEMKTCKFSKCGKSILRMYVEAHENEECPHREIICEGECGLMIPLSESPLHNCVTALKSHIEEKNRMIEQLKVKLHELNTLSQSLNDQLLELRQQLNDRNRLFSEDLSDISESDITDYMSDELSPDSEFQDSWFDSTASNGSVDHADTADNDVSTNDATNNVADQDNNNVGGTGGSDVVQQVERTVVSSLFELSSRLERVRNQMRAVLNSGLVQDANTLNDEVRIPSAALDAIVNNNNGDIIHLSIENNDDTNHSNDGSNNNEVNNHGNNESSMDHDVSDSDLSVHSGEEDDSVNAVGMSENNGDSNANHPWSYSSHDSFDGSWISATDSHHTPSHDSPSSITSGLGYDNNDANDSYANEDQSNKDQYSSTHVILSQPPDSPSDSTGSFSSIPSTWSVENSPAMAHVDDTSSQHVRSDSPASSSSHQTSLSYGNKSPDSSERSQATCKSSDHNGSWSSHRSTNSTGIGSENQSEQQFSLSSHDSPYSASKRVYDWMDSGEKDETYISDSKKHDDSMSRHSDAGSTSDSSVVDCLDSTDEHKSDGGMISNDHGSDSDILHSDNETSHIESNTPVHEAENSCESHINDRLNAENEFYHVDVGNDNENDVDSIGLSDVMEEFNYEHNDEESHGNFAQVSKCEPDSTQSPLGNLAQNGTLGSDANTPVVISTATDSSDSSESESLKYLTKRRRQTPSYPDYGENNVSGEIIAANVVKIEENQQSVSLGLENGPTVVCSRRISDNNNPSKSVSRKRKTESEIGCTLDGKRNRLTGTTSMHFNGSSNRYSPSTDSGIVADCSPGDSPSAHHYGFRKRLCDSETRVNVDSNKNSKPNGTSQTVQHSSHMSPSRHRSSRRDTSQHYRRNRSGASKRTPNQANVTTDNNGQSLNVKIDLSLINYSGHLNSESTNASLPTAKVVHRSANISPLSTSTASRKESSYNFNRQHSSETNKTSSQKADDSTHHSSHKTRASQSQRHESQHQNRSSANNAIPPKSLNTSNNLSHRDFPNCWRDESDNSSDDVLESGSGNSGTEIDVGFESDSSYEVAVPKSTAALLEEYASDESDESWTVSMG